MQLVISLTNSCNLNCKHCFVNKLSKINIDFSSLENVATTWDVSSVAMLGGEPFLYPDFKKVVKLFDIPVTIYTNGIVIGKNPDAVIEGDNIIYAVSIEGRKDFHENIRGEGTFDLVNSCLYTLSKKLEKEKIASLILRMTISKENINDMYYVKKLADRLGAKVMYFPYIGNREPFPAELQLKLFRFAIINDNVTIYSPQFWQFCGYNRSTCQAGLYRLHIAEDGDVNPCQWIRNSIFGNIDCFDFDYFKERGAEYHEDFVTIKKGCERCIHASECRGGCRLCSDYLSCPIKRRVTANNYLNINELKIASTKYEKTFKGLKVVGC